MKQLVTEGTQLLRQGEYRRFVTRSKNKFRQVLNKRFLAGRLISDLKNSADPEQRMVGETLERVREDTPPKDDLDCFDLIDAKRTELSSITSVSQYNEYMRNDQYEFGDQSVDEADNTVKTDVAGAAKCPETKGRILYYLIRNSNAQSALELGTSVGISGLYEASAATKTGGTVVTLEGSRIRKEVAEKTFSDANLDNIEVVHGRFADTLPGVLDERSPFDFVLIDGHHDETATKQYWETIKPEIEASGVVVFDDIHWSKGMERAWSEICHDDQFTPIVETNNYGIGVVKQTNRKTPKRISI